MCFKILKRYTNITVSEFFTWSSSGTIVQNCIIRIPELLLVNIFVLSYHLMTK